MSLFYLIMLLKCHEKNTELMLSFGKSYSNAENWMLVLLLFNLSHYLGNSCIVRKWKKKSIIFSNTNWAYERQEVHKCIMVFLCNILAFFPLHFNLSLPLECVYLKGKMLLVRYAMAFYTGVEMYCVPHFISWTLQPF